MKINDIKTTIQVGQMAMKHTHLNIPFHLKDVPTELLGAKNLSASWLGSYSVQRGSERLGKGTRPSYNM